MASRHFNSKEALAETRDVTFEITNDLLGCVDRHGHFAALNPAWERTFGYTAQVLMSRPFIEFVHEADREMTLAEVDRLRDGGPRAVGFQNRYEVRGDGWRWISWLAELRDGVIFFIGHDITDRVADQHRLFILTRMIEGVDDAIFTTTIDGIVTSWNHVSEEIYGYTAAEAIGRSTVGLNVPEDRADEPQDITSRLLSGEGVRQFTTQRRRKDGSALTVSQTCSLMRDEDHEVLGVIVVGRDISELSLEDAEFNSEIDTLVWVGRVRDAIDEGRVVFFAQPIISLRGEPISYELLCRMEGRNGEMVPPAKFLPAAENYGLVEELDLLAIHEAARLIASGHQISINLSTATVGRRHIVDVIADELRRAGARPESLTVEITETALMKNMVSAQRFANALADLGARLALDDFGTGFGGFTYLKKLSIHRLKIDVEFVRDLHSSVASQHVVKAVVALAEGFNLDTVAEGVEDEESAIMLEEYGVNFVQGFYYGRPGPIDEMLGEPTVAGPR